MRKILCVFVVCLAACSPAPPTAAPISTPAASATPAPTTPTPAASATPSPAPTTEPSAAPRPLAVSHVVALARLPGAGRHPDSVALLGDKVYVADSASDNVAVVQNDRVVGFVPVGRDPESLAADPAQRRLYVASQSDETISLITNDQVARTRRVPAPPRALLFFESRLFVGLDSSDGILVLDPQTLQTDATIFIPNGLTTISLAADPLHHRIYANLYDRTAVVDSTTLQVANVFSSEGSYQTLLALPQSDSVLMSIYDSSTRMEWLTAYDPVRGAPRGRVQVGGDPAGAVANGDGTRVYVADAFTNDVTVVDPKAMQIVATIPVDVSPNAPAIDDRTRRLYVANADSDNLIAIDTDTNRLAGVVPLAMRPTAILGDEDAGRVYVANASTNSVFVLQGAAVVKEISVGLVPTDLARDASTHQVYVADEADGTLSVIDESTDDVRVTAPITRLLTSVAVDAAHRRLYADEVILDLRSLSPIGRLNVQANGTTLTGLDYVRVNPNNGRIYADGSNGIPGSNGRRVTYSLDGDTLQQRAVLDYDGNTSTFEIDPETNSIYLAGHHPLAGTDALRVFDADDRLVYSTPLVAPTTGMAYNPQTHHLFLAHGPGGESSAPDAAGNWIEVFDTRSFGRVTTVRSDSPGPMTRLGNTIYVANSLDGSISLIQDAPASAPPSPTPLPTATAFPTVASATK